MKAIFHTFTEARTESKIKYIGTIILSVVLMALIINSFINPQPFEL